MTTTISRLYNSPVEAQEAVRSLEAAGLSHSDISIMASNADNWYDSTGRKHDKDNDGVDDRAEGAGKGAGIGAVLGGGAGLLAGLGLIAIPGVGPVVAAGWLAATAAGALAGGATGGIIGALTEAGVSREDADVYAEGIRRGGALVTARVPDGERSRYEAVMDRAAVNVRQRGDLYRKSGWTGYNPSAAPYTADQVRAERDSYISR
ncbi:MAG: hypothetical protein JO056_00975 [Alphaproteobacteria bacterium]|nr:hypothetical protein [Alphaproteobacteria bacterium]